MISCDYDPATVYHEATVKAAKEHRCCECHGTIRVGERYERVKWLWEGSWDTLRTCPDCVHLRCQITQALGGGCGWLHGGMLEQVEDLAYGASLGDVRAAKLVAMFNVVAELRGVPRIPVPKIDKEDEEEIP